MSDAEASNDSPRRLDIIETRWSLVRRSVEWDDADSALARQTLVLRYSAAIRGYCRAILGSDHLADEVAQDAVVRLLKGDFGGADPARGRFRDLLRTAIRNMSRNRLAYEQRRAGRGELRDDAIADAAEPIEADDPWLVEWRTALLENAWSALRGIEERTPGSSLHSVLRARTDHPDETSEQLAARLSERLGRSIGAAAVRQNLKRARTRFCELLADEVADGLQEPTRERVVEELIALDLWSSLRDLLPEDWRPSRGGRAD